MGMGPEGWKQNQFTGLWLYSYLLEMKFGFSTWTGNVIEIPNRDQLPLAEFSWSAIDMPVVVLAGCCTLDLITEVTKAVAGKKWMYFGQLSQGGLKRKKQASVDILPLFPSTDTQVGGQFYRCFFRLGLSDTSLNMLIGVFLKTAYGVGACGLGQGIFYFIYKTVEGYFPGSIVH